MCCRSATPAASARSRPPLRRPRRRDRRHAGRRGLLDRQPQRHASSNFGDARNYGFLGGHLASPVVAMAVTPDGRGYWLAEAGGDVFAFGDAVNPAAGHHGQADVARRGHGSHRGRDRRLAGRVQRNGSPRSAPRPPTARSRCAPGSPVTSIAAMPAVAGSSSPAVPEGLLRLRHQLAPVRGARGRPKTVPLPGPPNHPSGTVDFTVAVVGVDGWAIGSQNPCLRAEVQWAEKARKPNGAPYDLYMFLNSPVVVRHDRPEGAGGHLRQVLGHRQESCLAYNYGYNSARIARQLRRLAGRGLAHVVARHRKRHLWPVLVVRPDAQLLTIQGAIDYLHSQKLTVGIYSTAVQWQGITGGYVPSGPQVPIWVAGAYWTSPALPVELRLLAAVDPGALIAAPVTPSPAARPGCCRRPRGRTTTRSTPTTPADTLGGRYSSAVSTGSRAHPHRRRDAQARWLVRPGCRVEVRGVVEPEPATNAHR